MHPRSGCLHIQNVLPNYFFGLPGFGLSFLSMSSTHLLVAAPEGAVERSIGLFLNGVKSKPWDIRYLRRGTGRPADLPVKRERGR
jgi:hypothetical protein